MLSLPRIIGHRGAAGLAPENTLAGFRRAASLGLEWVEFDTQLAADGPVVLHDATLERTSTARGAVRDVSMASLAAADAGGWFGSAYAGERVPALEETLIELQGLQLGANVELKAEPGSEQELAGAVADVVRRAWSADAGKLLVSSFSVPALACFARQAPHVPCGLLVGALPADWEDVARDIGCVSVHADHRKLTARAADAVKAGGLLLAVYTVNTIPEARRMLSFGVNSLITDRPDIISAAL